MCGGSGKVPGGKYRGAEEQLVLGNLENVVKAGLSEKAAVIPALNQEKEAVVAEPARTLPAAGTADAKI